MNSTERSRDVICGGKDLISLWTFRKFPIFMGCVDPSCDQADAVADMSWSISRASGSIQLDRLIPLEDLYRLHHGSGTVGALWLAHHKAFAEFVARCISESVSCGSIPEREPRNVLEIGGLHGELARQYFTIGGQANWTIVEPNPILPDGLPVKVISGFFDERFWSPTRYDSIVHSHVLEHAYNPLAFLRHQTLLLKENGILIFSIPNMVEMLRRKYTNVLNFEHTYLITDEYVRRLLVDCGMEVSFREYFREDHSIFYCARRVHSPAPVPMGALYGVYKGLWHNYVQHYQDEVFKLNKIISRARESHQPVYVFGAHVFAQYLVNFGMSLLGVSGVLDNDEVKQGNRLSGTPFLCFSPQVLAEYMSTTAPIVILRAGVYNDEIREQLLTIHPGVQIV